MLFRSGFFSAAGNFAVEKKSETVKVLSGGTTSDVLVDMLTIGANGATAFAGVNGGTADKVGLELTNTNIALLLATETAVAKRKWTTLQASVASISVVGVDGLTASASDLAVEINKAAAGGSLIDYSAQAVTVKTGPTQTMDLTIAASKGALMREIGRASCRARVYRSV